MLKKICIGLLAGFVAIPCYALQIKITPGPDFVKNQDEANFSFETVAKGESGSMEKTGIPFAEFSKNFDEFLPQFFARFRPSDTEKVTLSLGYRKDGLDVAPVTCQNLKLKEVNTIVLDEKECIVS